MLLNLTGHPEEFLKRHHAVFVSYVESLANIKELDVAVQKRHVVTIYSTVPFCQFFPIFTRMGWCFDLIIPSIVTDEQQAGMMNDTVEGQILQPLVDFYVQDSKLVVANQHVIRLITRPKKVVRLLKSRIAGHSASVAGRKENLGVILNIEVLRQIYR